MADVLERDLKTRSDIWAQQVEALSRFSIKPSDTGDADNSLSIINRIGDLGFTNSKCVREKAKIIQGNMDFNSAVRQAAENLAFMIEVKKYFGSNTILVKRSDILSIIRKYNLVCGSFSNYLGTPPEENIIDIENAKDKIKKLRESSLSEEYPQLYAAYNKYVLGKIDGITVKWDDAKDKRRSLKRKSMRILNAFPYVLGKTSSYNSGVTYGDYLSTILPKDEFSKIRSLSATESDNMFIIAPANEMNNREKIRIQAFRPRTEDPLICSLTPNAVIVFSRWGKEAEDKAFRKYDEIFESLKIK